jgi:hypothetical protein
MDHMSGIIVVTYENANDPGYVSVRRVTMHSEFRCSRHVLTMGRPWNTLFAVVMGRLCVRCLSLNARNSLKLASKHMSSLSWPSAKY